MARQSHSELNLEPTMFQEINFLKSLYDGTEDCNAPGSLKALFGSNGYRIRQVVEIHGGVKCCFFTPRNFPINQQEALKFAFDECKESTLTLGICLASGPIVDFACGVMTKGVREGKALDDDTARSVCDVKSAMNQLWDAYPLLSESGIKLDICICGYALGGLLAQALTVKLQGGPGATKYNVKCRTYESPGLPPSFHEQAEHHTKDDINYWKERIKNYKSMPNPANTMFRDIGSVFHLMHLDQIAANKRWISRCIFESTGRVIFYSNVVCHGIQAAASTVAIRALTTAMLGTYASELGLSKRELVALHRLEAMEDCFHSNGNLRSEACHEMSRWPHYSDFKPVIPTLRSVGRSFIAFHPRNPGIHTMLVRGGKKRFVCRKLRHFPGYERCTGDKHLRYKSSKKKTE